MKPWRSRKSDGEEGSATVLALALIATCLIFAVSLAGLTAVQAARGRAQTAADLAALAAADAWVTSAGDPCAIAGTVAAANGAALAGCSLAASDVIVRASVPVRGPFASLGLTASASARAGPE